MTIPTPIRVAIGSDHAGFDLKDYLRLLPDFKDALFLDCGTFSRDSVDYPDYAKAVADKIKDDEADCGVLICGSGIGISIAANRIKGIRAALCTDMTMARLCREHNDANIVVLGGQLTGHAVATDIVRTFLDTPFSQGERHLRRINKIEHC